VLVLGAAWTWPANHFQPLSVSFCQEFPDDMPVCFIQTWSYLIACLFISVCKARANKPHPGSNLTTSTDTVAYTHFSDRKQ